MVCAENTHYIPQEAEVEYFNFCYICSDSFSSTSLKPIGVIAKNLSGSGIRHFQFWKHMETPETHPTYKYNFIILSIIIVYMMLTEPDYDALFLFIIQ